jgi:subtilisin family serine protease
MIRVGGTFVESHYIIVRRSDDGDAKRREGFGLGTRRMRRRLIVEYDTLTDRKASDLSRLNDVEAVIREIPLRLVQPVAATWPGGPDAPESVGWGVDAVGARDTPFTGNGVRVAVLDTGIDRKHECFKGVELIEVDYTGEGNGDGDGHGTHCAATIFGRDVCGVRVGVARGVERAFIGKVVGKGGAGTSALLRAIHDAVEEGCQVISMSLAFDFPGAAARLQEKARVPPDLATAIALHDYAANLRLFDRVGQLIQAQAVMNSEDIVLIGAAGNESKRDEDPGYEMPAAPPSEAEGFVSVGAVGQGMNGMVVVAPFSNTGCTVCGPGIAVLSAQAGTTSGLVPLDGTSMATPHVAGVVALWAEKQSALPVGGGLFRARPTLLSHVLASASHAKFETGFDPVAAGMGLVQAPTE